MSFVVPWIKSNQRQYVESLKIQHAAAATASYRILSCAYPAASNALSNSAI